MSDTRSGLPTEHIVPPPLSFLLAAWPPPGRVWPGGPSHEEGLSCSRPSMRRNCNRPALVQVWGDLSICVISHGSVPPWTCTPGTCRCTTALGPPHWYQQTSASKWQQNYQSVKELAIIFIFHHSMVSHSELLISASLPETNRVISQQSVKTLTAGSHRSCSMFTWFSYLSNWESKIFYIFCLGTFMPLQLNGPWINIHTNSIVWATEPVWETFRPVHLTSHNMANNSLGCCSAANTRCCHQSGLVLICNETSSFSTSLGLMYDISHSGQLIMSQWHVIYNFISYTMICPHNSSE